MPRESTAIRSTAVRLCLSVALAVVLAVLPLAMACSTSETPETANTNEPAADATAPVSDEVEEATDRVAQVSFVDGEVTAKQPDSDEWRTVDVNSPVFEGYELYAPDGAQTEVQLGDGKFARFGDGATVLVDRLDPDWAQLQLTEGTLVLALNQFTEGEHFEIDTPHAAVIPSGVGSYRVDVSEDGRTRVTIVRGSAEITTPTGSFVANEGDVVDFGEETEVEVVSNGARDVRDDFDDWTDSRDAYYTDFYQRDVPEPVRLFNGRNDIIGVAALIGFGIWQALDDDRWGWQPAVARDRNWTPYRDGYWDHNPSAGWVWVSNEPWGWAPYHHGRWDHSDRYGWVWLPYGHVERPGPAHWRERHRWRPAEVYFFRPPGSQNYVWVPLAPGEPFVPYSEVYVVNSPNVGVVNFRPRYLKERRAVYYVTPDGLERRVRPRRGHERFARYDFKDSDDLTVVRLPKPKRAIAERQVADRRYRPSERALRRAVVVDERSIERAERKAARKADRKADRPERREVRRAKREKRQVEKRAAEPRDRATKAERPRAGRAADTKGEKAAKRGGKAKGDGGAQPQATQPAREKRNKKNDATPNRKREKAGEQSKPKGGKGRGGGSGNGPR